MGQDQETSVHMQLAGTGSQASRRRSGREQLTRMLQLRQTSPRPLQCQARHGTPSPSGAAWQHPARCSPARHNPCGQQLTDRPCTWPRQLQSCAGSVTQRQTQKDTSFYLQHSSSDRQQKKKREQYSSTTQQRKGNGSHNSPAPLPKPTGVGQSTRQPPPCQLGAQAGRGLLPPLPTVFWGHRAAPQLAWLLCSNRQGWHSCSPSLRGDDAETT